MANVMINVANSYKGAVLAAGFGTRLRPLTAKTPKPLLPFMGSPLLLLQLLKLKMLGLGQVMVNAHYRWQDIAQFLEKTHLGAVEVKLFVEENEILGTGGVFAPSQEWRDGAGLVVVNSDIVTDFDLKELMDFHQKQDVIATMALSPEILSDKETVVWSENNRIIAFGGKKPTAAATPHNFLCMQILEDEFLREITEVKFSSIIDYYKKFLAEGRAIGAFCRPSFWFDIGTIEKYRQVQVLWQERYGELENSSEVLARFGLHDSTQENL